MEFSTSHEKDDLAKDYRFTIYEDLGENKGVNSADVAVYIEDFIDSRTELRLEIRRQALSFLKRAVESLEYEIGQSSK